MRTPGVELRAHAKKKERLWVGPRRTPREIQAILGAKRFPKGSPRGSKIETQRRLELKTRFLQKVMFVLISLDFDVPGALFWMSNLIENGFGLQLGCVMAAEGLLNGSWSALGGLRSRKNVSWRPPGAVLERLRSLQDGLREIGGR